MELVESHSVNIRDVKDVASLLTYFHHSQDWHLGIDSFEEVEDLLYDFSAADLGLKDEEFAKIKSLRQLPPLEEGQQWGIFCVEFETEKLSITALRKILSRLVPTRRNATHHAVWDERDLLFLCFWGTGNNRTVCVAHFESKDGGLAAVRTIHCAPALEDEPNLKHFEDRLCLLQWPDDPSNYEAWYAKWASAFTMGYHEAIRSSKDLAERMATIALRIKKDILDAMAVENEKGFAHRLYKKVKGALLHSLKENDFADMYAQMIVYGLFTARCHDQTPDTFSAAEALELIPNTNPFLKGLMRDCLVAERGGAMSFDELGIGDVIDMFSRVNAAEIAKDFDRRTGGGREDPITYFYEFFLKSYDAKIKDACGQFYTPKPVVGFMVRAVDHILKTQFNLPDGLATDATKKVKYTPDGKKTSKEKDVPAIQILDPATGTGTFIREIILKMHETFLKKNVKLKGEALAEAWSRYVDKNILPRLNAFELMMAPYAIAHMKLAMVLRDTGYDFKSNERLHVYLTNSLEEPGDSNKQMMLFDDDPLAAESVAANAVKKNTGINIVIGNPPYSGISQNNGEWIAKLVNEYKVEPGGKKKLQERKNWLNDDYVKFIRLAQDFVERSGSGVLAYINPHGFIDNPTFRGMRWRLMQAFDEIYVLNLHGNSKKNEKCPDGSKDENVFDIQQGVSINIFIKKDTAATNCAIYYADIYGLRDAKYAAIEKSSLCDIKWQVVVPSEPMCFFVPKDEEGKEDYTKGFRIDELMNLNSTAILTMGDSFAVSMDKEDLCARIRSVNSDRPTAESLKARYSLGKNYADFLVGNIPLVEGGDVRQYNYRPFDTQWINYSSKTIWRPRTSVMQHFEKGMNLGVVVCRQSATSDWTLVNVTNCLADDCFVSNKTKERGYVFPLYLYQEYHGNMQKVPNLNPKIVKKIETVVGKMTPEDIFNYIYAVLHSPTYRLKYKEFLKIDFPRIPYPTDAKTFHALAELGGRLVAIHTMKDFDEAEDVDFVEVGGVEVVKVKWNDGAVYINGESYFTNVERETFDQYIGGYQPLQKWLKDRKGRTLSAADISHYKRIVRALRRTAALMSEIDKLPVVGE